jgi:hypothetical protein
LFAARCEATQGVSKLEELAIRVAFAGEIYSLRESQKRGKIPSQKSEKKK